jgi:hypothetical protein
MNAQITTIEPEALEYLPAKTLLRLMERQQRAAKNCKAFKLALGTFPDLFRALEELDIEPGFGLDDDYIGLSFAGDGPKLAAVWKLLRQNGYKNSCHPKKGDTTFYAFWEQEGHAKFFMNFTSTMCRRVKVGTKTVEQDVYETHCGDMPTDLEIEAPKNAVVGAADEIPF